MPYVLEQDYIDSPYGEVELIQLTDKPPLSGVVDSNRFDTVRDVAESIIDAQLSSIYTIPLSVVNDDIKDIILAVIRSKLYVNHEPDEVKEGYNDAMRRLALYVDGTASIAGATTATVSANAAVQKGCTAIFDSTLFATSL